MSARQFEARLCRLVMGRFSADDVTNGTAVLRRHAIAVLKPVPWKLIPYTTCDRRPVVKLKTLMMLALCLDEAGATPAQVTSEQIHLAWTAAGKAEWLQYVVAHEFYHRAVLQAMAQDGSLFGGIAARLREKMP